MPSLPIAPENAVTVDLSALRQFAEAGIVSRTLFAGESLRVVLFGIAKGQELSEHTSSRRAFVQILSGDCSFKSNGEWRRMQTGELLHMPPGHAHAVKADLCDCSFLLTLLAEDKAVVAHSESSAEANA